MAVAECKSFTLAAKKLNLTQSAVSHSIRALEEYLECTLFSRTSKRVFLTDSGGQLVARAQSILEEVRNLREELLGGDRWNKNHLRIGTSMTICEIILPVVLREFQDSFPRSRISINASDAASLLERLGSAEIDLAITLEPEEAHGADFRPLFTDELAFVVSPSHPFARKHTLTREDLAAEQYIVYGKTSMTHQIVKRIFRELEIPTPSMMELGSFTAINQLAKLGLGVGILAPWVAQKEIQEKSLAVVRIPTSATQLRRTWGILVPKGRRLSLPEEIFCGVCEIVIRTQIMNNPLGREWLGVRAAFPEEAAREDTFDAVLFISDESWPQALALLDALKPSTIFVTGRELPADLPEHVTPLHDASGSQGPLAGMTAALENTRARRLLALASDLPNMTEEYLRELLAAAPPGKGAVPKTGRFYQPLAAVYPAEALGVAQTCLAGHADKSMQHFIKELLQADLVAPVAVSKPEREILHNEYEAPAKG
jgi:DNA-binding transcriptional LysR family regulator/molybdopterin-guanine dinucleotide biosynthesis protein A